MIKTFDTLPMHCEYCGETLVWDGVNLVCNNPMCYAKSEEKIKAWCMNIAPIDGLGWATIKKLLDTSFFITERIDTIEKLYCVARNPQARNHNVKSGSEADLFNKMLDKLCGQIKISQFLLALNIPGLGKIGAKNVENSEAAMIAFQSVLCFHDKSDFCGDCNVWAKLLQDVNTAESLYTTYNEYFIYCYNIVKNQIIFDGIDMMSVKEKGSVVITGALSVKRDAFVAMLEEKGWKVASKINKDVKYLITNTPDSGTSKNKEADKFGISKVTETDFINNIM